MTVHTPNGATVFTILLVNLLFSFAEYPVACYGDEGEENPP